MGTFKQKTGEFCRVASARHRKPYYQRFSFWGAVLLAVYTIAGFLIVPWWLERTLPDELEARLGWQASVEEVNLNPFTLSVEAVELNAADSDNERVLAFEELYINLSLWPLFTGVISFQEITLDDPFLRLDLLEDYSLNLARDWRRANPQDPQEQADNGTQQPDSEPAKLYFDSLEVNGGELLLRDFSSNGEETFRITPLDLAINDLATWPRNGNDSSDYLLAEAGNQTIEWEGEISLAPVYSRGHLELGNVDYETVSHFLGRFLPYDLRGGRATLAANYELRADEDFQLVISDGVLDVRDLAAGIDQNSEEAFLETGSVLIEPIRYDLMGQQLDMGAITIESLGLNVQRGREGGINLMGPFAREEEESEDANGDRDSDSDQSLRWSLAGIELDNSRVRWQDQQTVTPADIELQELKISVGGLNHRFEDPTSYHAEGNLTDGGRVVFDGQATFQPFTLESGFSGTDIRLGEAEPYLRDVLNLAIRSGRLSVDGNLDLDGQQESLTGTFSGTGEVADLAVALVDSEEPVLSWQTLRLEPLEYNLQPARLEIGSIVLTEPQARIVRNTDGLLNVQNVVRSSDESSTDSQENSASDGRQESEPDFIFRVGDVMIESAAMSYVDRTMDPPFSTGLDQLNGTVTGLSNVSPQQGKVSLRGRVGDVSRLELTGSVGTLGTDDVSDLLLELDDYSLPALSPYFARYLGYQVESGKLDLEMDYEITGTQLDASNLIVMERFELGSAVASDQAIDAPIKLGLALLRNSNGVIRVNLPVSGDIASPEFNISRVIMGTFGNTLAKAATSPFSVLGSIAGLAGLSGEELGRISFVPGRVELAEGEQAKLDSLAEALKERPGLALNIRGAVAPEVDGEAMRRQRVFREAGIEASMSVTEKVDRLERFYPSVESPLSLPQFRQQVAEEQGSEPDQQQWLNALLQRLAEEQTLPGEALGNLASERGTWLRNQLNEQSGVSADQLFLGQTSRDASVNESGQVVLQFELDPR